MVASYKFLFIPSSFTSTHFVKDDFDGH